MKILSAKVAVSANLLRMLRDPKAVERKVKADLAHAVAEKLVLEDGLYTVEDIASYDSQVFTITLRIDNI